VVGQESADGGATACIFLLSGACFDESAADSQTRPCDLPDGSTELHTATGTHVPYGIIPYGT